MIHQRKAELKLAVHYLRPGGFCVWFRDTYDLGRRVISDLGILMIWGLNLGLFRT